MWHPVTSMKFCCKYHEICSPCMMIWMVSSFACSVDQRVHDLSLSSKILSDFRAELVPRNTNGSNLVLSSRRVMFRMMEYPRYVYFGGWECWR